MKNRVAVVTGAASGLGLNVSRRLLREGFKVVGVARRPADAAAALGSDFTLLQGNVASPEVAAEAFAIAARLGTVDVLVNCAGLGLFGPCGTYTRDDIDKVLEANLIGTVLFSEKAAALFAPGGVIVNVMSTSAQIGRAGEALYCAAKWGAKGYTESIRAELKDRGIRVIGVYPGGMNTHFWAEAQGATKDPSGFMDPAEVADLIVDALLGANAGIGYVTDLTISRA